MSRTTSWIALAVILLAAGAFIGTQQVNSQTSAPATTTAASTPPAGTTGTPEIAAVDQDAPYFEACSREGLSASACIGRLIWFKATGGNERFHTYVFQQRVGVLVDWFRVLRSDQRDDRFKAWGIINDPACCKPGSDGCPAKSLDETFGLDWCPGDDVLLKYVGREGYRDPACDLKDAPLAGDDPHAPGGKDQRHSACDLRFGTSTGALGFRKFPNPRFDAAAWRKLNNGQASWEGYNQVMVKKTGVPSDERATKLADGSVEPPFLVGTTCASCHVAFRPDNPPADPAHPKWENLSGLVGNQYIRMSELLGSGMPRTSLEWQMFAHPRPGVTDTSAIPNDQVNNPGSINAIINLAQRPLFPGEQIAKWRKVTSCAAGSSGDACWCEPGRDGKCWQRGTRSDDTTLGKPGVHHILKGGEDSIGGLEAIQRVYFNIGSCSEQCWLNNLSDLRQLDPAQRNFGQTVFSIGQCRRDCPNFRAVEDRLANILDFFLSAEGNVADLHTARDKQRRAANPKAAGYTRNDLIDDLEREFGKGAVARGKQVFGETCASCHSSVPDKDGGPFASRDVWATNDKGMRVDWLGNDQATAVSEVGTYRCRSLHSNHMAGHVWQEYGSETLRGRGPDANVKEPANGGRGYYRNISLLNLWAHAPFMHNNAIGPDICGKPANAANDFARKRNLDANGKLAAEQVACTAYDPSIEGRVALYRRSMEMLLNPAQRKPEGTLTDRDIIQDMGPRFWNGKTEKPLIGDGKVVIPAGVPANFLTSMRHKDFIVDLFLAKRDKARTEARLGKELTTELGALADRLVADPSQFVKIIGEKSELIDQHYSHCTAVVENEGHRFGEGLPDSDKKALIAFLATL
ncbi:MAG: hypothetical protein REI94_14985 [Moraxellaceae bacterium]|nr:hypothetical protein [Moraxellaceae bacterium]